MISEDFWDRFLLLAKVCYMRDKEADIYDVFDAWRTRILGGWDYTPKYIAQLDAIIEEEERKNELRRLSL